MRDRERRKLVRTFDAQPPVDLVAASLSLVRSGGAPLEEDIEEDIDIIIDQRIT
jgi:hypothetical protein